MRAPPTCDELRAEAAVLATAGAILLAVGFPLTVFLTLLALGPGALSPATPLAAGAPLIVWGYGVCHAASSRWTRAKRLESSKQPAGGAASDFSV